MISIVVPVYNTPYDWIKSCHTSIMTQTFINFEVIYVNDGSTNEETLKFLDEIKDNKCRVINLEHVGICKVLNIGINECKYDYVARMDSDDIMYNNKLEYQYNFMKRNKFIDLTGTYMDCIKLIDDNWIISPTSNYHEPLVTFDVITTKPWIMNNPTVMFKKEKILSVGGYSEEISNIYAEDFDLFAKMFISGMVLYNIPTPLLIYRLSPNTLSYRYSPNNVNFIKEWQEKIKKSRNV